MTVVIHGKKCNDSPEIFPDGMDFWNTKTGILYGDPIAGKMALLKTTDGRISWQNISDDLNIILIPGEASIAASGTNIRCLKNGISEWRKNME